MRQTGAKGGATTAPKWIVLGIDGAYVPTLWGQTGRVLVTNNVESGVAAEAEARVSLRLSPGAQAAVEEIKQLGDFSSSQEAIRRAIADERYLQRKRKEGWTFLLRKGDEYIELVWPS